MSKLSEADRAKALEAYRKEYCIPITVSEADDKLAGSLEVINSYYLNSWVDWLRSWQLATQAADEQLEAYKRDLRTAVQTLELIASGLQPPGTYEDLARDALVKIGKVKK